MNKIQKVTSILILALIAHAIEEHFGNFYNTDWSIIVTATFFGITPLTLWLSGQVMVAIFLILCLTLVLSKHTPFWFVTIFSIILVFELSHPYYALLTRSYYPGLVTSLIFPIIGFYFFREYRNNRYAGKLS